MFRTARRIAPLVSSLFFGTATAVGATLALGMVAGCADEADPETHVKKLQDPSTRSAAVNRLIQFFEDAMTRDNKDRNGPTVKPLLDKIVEPMTQICVAGDLDDRTNAKLIKFLSDARDPRSEACLVKSLKDYKPESTEENVRWASRAVGAMKLKAAGAPLMEVFTKLKASKPKAGTIYRDVHDAMVAMQDPTWKPALIERLGHPVDQKDIPNLRDEMFWQITAIELLGDMQAAEAVKPILKVMLSPAKADAGATAVNALIKIGKPSIAPTVALLKGDDADLVAYSKTEVLKGAGEKPNEAMKKLAETQYVATAALVLATIGRDETSAPLMDILGGKVDDVTRAIVARELTKLPKTPQTVSTFKESYEKLPVNASIPPGNGAKEALLEASGMFFENELVGWYVKTAKGMKGEDADLEPVRESSLLAALKLMKSDDLSTVEELASMKGTAEGKPTTVGKGFEKEMRIAKEVLNECAAKVDCYVAKLGDPKSQVPDTQFQGIKSAYMIGVLGDASARDKIVAQFPKITNPAVRFVSVSVIDFLSPKGDKAMADKLQKIVDEAEEKKDAQKMAANSPFKTVIYRLRARAQ